MDEYNSYFNNRFSKFLYAQKTYPFVMTDGKTLEIINHRSKNVINFSNNFFLLRKNIHGYTLILKLILILMLTLMLILMLILKLITYTHAYSFLFVYLQQLTCPYLF